MNAFRLFSILFLAGFLVIIPSLIDESFAVTKQYKVYIESPPSYAPSGTYQATLDALNFWEKRDNISFVLTTAGNHDIYIKWAKNLDERHVGYAYGKFIEVGLGDGYCNNQWNQFHIDYLRNILTHEVGHAIGYGHESQSDSIMNSGGRDDKHYGVITLENSLGKNWVWHFPICNFDAEADINYVVESDSTFSQFSVVLVPDYDSVQKIKNNKNNFSYYVMGECLGKDVVKYGGTCSVSTDSLMVIKNKNNFANVSVKMQEVNIPNQYYKVYASNIHKQTEIKNDESITLLGSYYSINDVKNQKTNIFEGDTACMIFTLRDYHDRTYSSWYPVSFKTITVEKQITNANGNSLGSPTTKTYTTDSSGEVRICKELRLYSDYWKSGIKYSAYFAGDTKFDKSTSPLTTIIFEEKKKIIKTPESKIIPKFEKEQMDNFKNTKLVKVQLNRILSDEPIISYVLNSFYNYPNKEPTFTLYKQKSNEWSQVIVVSSKRVYTDTDEGNFGNASYYSEGKYKVEYKYVDSDSQTLYKGTSYFEIKNKNVDSSSSKINTDKNNESMLNTSVEMWKKYDFLKNKVNSIEKNSQTIKNTLSGLTHGNSQSKQMIDTAWDLFKVNESEIRSLESQKLVRMNDSIKKEYLGNAKAYYTQAVKKIQVIEQDFTKITKIIREVKESGSDKKPYIDSKISKKEIQELQSQAYSKFEKLKTGIDRSKKELQQTQYGTSKEKETINKAWNLLKQSQAKLDEIKNRIQKGDKQLGYGYYENAKTFFVNNEKMSKEIGDNLGKISKLIEQTKPKSCFFWC